jgi:hypothetical protein
MPTPETDGSVGHEMVKSQFVARAEGFAND